MSDISVIVPVYNGARFIGETLGSIAAQTLPAAEIIVVDDDSNDDTRARMMACPVAVTYIANPRNRGVCFSRNVGLMASTKCLIALCDQDDIWHPEKLERQAAAMNDCPGIDFLFTNFVHLRGSELDRADKFSGAPRDFWPEITESSDGGTIKLVHPALPKLLEFQPVFPSTIMFRRELLEAAGFFDEGLGHEQSEDLEFLFRCDLNCRLAALTMPLATVRKHEWNYSGDTVKTTLSQVRVLRHVLEADRRYAVFQGAITRQIVSRSIQAFNGAFAAGDLATSRDVIGAIPWRSRGVKLWVKAAIAAMPAPLAKLAQTLILSGTSDHRLHGTAAQLNPQMPSRRP